MKVAVVEDDLSVGNLIKKALSKEGYSVKLFSTAEALNDAIFSYGERFDLIILDVMLPGTDGIKACSFLREKGVEIPIMILTALSEEEDKVAGLDSGADDYVTKPFSIREFLARVRALTRRSRRSAKRELSLTTKGVIVNGKEIKLTTKEREVLKVLISKKGQVVSKDEIFNKVWKGEGSKRVVDVYIKYLRDKLGERIQTVWGIGYRLD
ncbi:two-component system alkaline phosphatase synthesis response regulator PhoP [Thermovibrio guaymasensis]|uniref:Two-component system alkaline phosphatase synthesis response regulator PhoP n=1 Tax=Thermovibrio guaymasensis TaxID=240167 RepID=A0A420W9R4_9BACT|nr:response regulator transcription factor [Thermovibrio guaymasensis]RKQ64071.1 two-component system alkaline phosphatase synthesis response regulator PhoP [Thermovibrio guaymasensis]